MSTGSIPNFDCNEPRENGTTSDCKECFFCLRALNWRFLNSIEGNAMKFGDDDDDDNDGDDGDVDVFPYELSLSGFNF